MDSRRLIASRDEFWRELIKRTRRPSRLAALILGLGAAAPLARDVMQEVFQRLRPVLKAEGSRIEGQMVGPHRRTIEG